ncbi:SAM-dependent methyltransferase [Micromonospora sonneratiae]
MVGADALPSAARVHNALLGGARNYRSDRELARQLLALSPTLADRLCARRAFAGRAVRWMLVAGIRQVVDIGAGLPVPGDAHEIAADAAPDAHVLYIDNDPVVVAARLIHGSVSVHADVRNPRCLLRSAAVRGLDLQRPVGLLLTGVLDHIKDSYEVAQILNQLRTATPYGSVLVLSAYADNDEEKTREAVNLYRSRVGPLIGRARDEVASWFAGWELVAPGVSSPQSWRLQSPVPDAHPWEWAAAGLNLPPGHRVAEAGT